MVKQFKLKPNMSVGYKLQWYNWKKLLSNAEVLEKEAKIIQEIAIHSLTNMSNRPKGYTPKTYGRYSGTLKRIINEMKELKHKIRQTK